MENMYSTRNHGWHLNGHRVIYASFYGVKSMRTSPVLVGYENKGLPEVKVERDGIHTSSAIDTARAAAEYASQLSQEYHNLLHRHLFMANPKIAGRFHSLITELTTMTDLTLHNVRFGNK